MVHGYVVFLRFGGGCLHAFSSIQYVIEKKYSTTDGQQKAAEWFCKFNVESYY